MQIQKPSGAAVLVLGEPVSGKTVMAAMAGKEFKLRPIVSSSNLTVLDQWHAMTGADMSVVYAHEETMMSAAGYITTPNNAKPTKWDEIRTLGRTWPEGPQPEEWDDSYILLIDDLTALFEEEGSPIRLSTDFEFGLLGQSKRPDQNMRVIGAAQRRAMGWLHGLVANPKRRYHIVVNCHLRRITVDTQRRMTPSEIRKQATTDEKIDMETVTSYYRYPVVIGQAQSELFARSFDWVVQVVRETPTDKPKCFLTPPNQQWDVNLFRCPLPIGHPLVWREERGEQVMKAGVSLPTTSALATILREHIKVKKETK